MPFPEDPTDTPVEPMPNSLVPDDLEDIDPEFEEKAEQAETDAALDKELEGTFPTSDPPSSLAGPDIEPERPDDAGSQ